MPPPRALSPAIGRAAWASHAAWTRSAPSLQEPLASICPQGLRFQGWGWGSGGEALLSRERGCSSLPTPQQGAPASPSALAGQPSILPHPHSRWVVPLDYRAHTPATPHPGPHSQGLAHRSSKGSPGACGTPGAPSLAGRPPPAPLGPAGVRGGLHTVRATRGGVPGSQSLRHLIWAQPGTDASLGTALGAVGGARPGAASRSRGTASRPRRS